jgi:hypothetical protein
MFAPGYFSPGFFAPSYFPPGGAEPGGAAWKRISRDGMLRRIRLQREDLEIIDIFKCLVMGKML